MSEISKTAAAAKKAVEKSQKKQTAERTTEQILSDIRKNLDAHLAVTTDDVRTLLAQYDWALGQIESWQNEFSKLVNVRDEVVKQIETAKTVIEELQAQVKTLTEKNEELRDVYEQENSNKTVTVVADGSKPEEALQDANQVFSGIVKATTDEN